MATVFCEDVVVEVICFVQGHLLINGSTTASAFWWINGISLGYFIDAEIAELVF